MTGRVFEASGQFLAVAEGWQRGPSTDPIDDPTQARRRRRQLLADARPNSGMDGSPGTWPQDQPRRREGGTEMPLNPDAVGTQSEPFEASWTSKDALLYAVGIGAGTDELAFTTENTAASPQQVFPTFPVVDRHHRQGRGGMGSSPRSARSTRRCSSTASRR